MFDAYLNKYAVRGYCFPAVPSTVKSAKPVRKQAYYLLPPAVSAYPVPVVKVANAPANVPAGAAAGTVPTVPAAVRPRWGWLHYIGLPLTFLGGIHLGAQTQKAGVDRINSIFYSEYLKRLAPYIIGGGLGATAGALLGRQRGQTLTGALLGAGAGIAIPALWQSMTIR